MSASRSCTVVFATLMCTKSRYATCGGEEFCSKAMFWSENRKKPNVQNLALFTPLPIFQMQNEWHNSHYEGPGLCPGHEIVGVVDTVGSAVTKFKVGQTVGVGCIVDTCKVCDNCTHGLEPHCVQGMTMTYDDQDKISGGFTYGGYSERIVVQERYVLSIPDGLDLAEAAPLLCAGITVYTPLSDAKIGPGKKVGVVGIGGLGHMALKLARALGAHVVAFTSKASKKDELITLGAHEAIVSSDEAELKRVANSLDLIIDTVSAGHDIVPFLNALVFKGTYCVVGAPPSGFNIPAMPLLFKRINFTGSAIGGIELTQEMLNLCGEKKFGATIELAPLKEVNTVLARLEAGDVRYRFVLDVKGAYHSN
jgi:uncharacterized zinc-type alcohol dehydrogenase-like protein